jgi:predicted alpha/beta superfamily hydrolase
MSRPFTLATVFSAGLLLTACSTLGAAESATTPAEPLPKVAFPNSAVHEVPSASGRRYQVWVDLPDAYFTSDKPLPVVFATDPNWAFPVLRTVRDFTGRRGRNIEPFILVGLGYDPALTPQQSRSRDYTISDPRRRPGHDPADYSFPAYGEAGAYRDYIETRVFPLIASTYRADMSRATFVGHSYGGLFGTYVLLTRPGMFRNYVLGSPSYWFDQHAIFELEAETARTRPAPRGRVFMLTGGYETLGPPPLYERKHDLVQDMRRFERTLAGRDHPGLVVTSEVVEGEDHLTVYPDVFIRGLLAVLPGTGPYDGG